MPDDKFYGLEYELDGVRVGDIEVFGRPLRDFSPMEFQSSAECLDFAVAYFDAVSVGDDFKHVLGEEFQVAYYAHRNGFFKAELSKERDDRLNELARTALKGAEYEILSTISVAHTGWEMDNDYVVVRVGGEIEFVGTDHGTPRVFGREHVLGLLESVEQQVAELKAALAYT